MESLYEKLGGGYAEVNGVLLPTFEFPERKPAIGTWGKRHLRWLRENQRDVCVELWLTGKLPGYLAQINEQAEDMLSRLVEQMACQEGVTEALKAENQMEWVGRMNSIRNRAEEIVTAELIHQ